MNKPVVKSFQLLMALLSGVYESLCDFYSGHVSAGAQLTPSFNNFICLVFSGAVRGNTPAASTMPNDRVKDLFHRKARLINSSNHWLILSTLFTSLLPRDLPQLCNVFFHQHN